MPGSYSPDRQLEMVRLYQSGLTTRQVAERCGCSTMAVRGALKRHGLTPRLKRVSPEQRREIIRLYRSGYSMQRAADAVGVSLHGAQRILISEGLNRPHRIYSLNEDFFADMKDEVQAWALGLLTADGYLDEDGITVGLSLKWPDRECVETFARLVGYGGPVRPKKRGDRIDARVSLTSRKLWADLSAMGLCPRKSLIVRPWAAPAHLLRHYFRGMIDGDGCIARNGKTGFTIRLVGSRPVVEAFADFVASAVGKRPSVRPTRNIWVSECSRLAHAQKLAAELYGGATVFLSRKKELADRIVAAVPTRRDYSDLTREQLLSLYAEHGDWWRVAEALGLPEPSRLAYLLKRHGLPAPPRRARKDSKHGALTAEKLLEAVAAHGSWSAAARSLGMSYDSLKQLRRRRRLL
jgi:transposase-like protein